MKSDNLLNLFWVIVWAILLILAIVAFFCKWANFAVIAIAFLFEIEFIHEYTRIAKMK